MAFIKIAIIGYVLVVAVIFFFQRKLLYHPNRNIGDPQHYGLARIERVFIRAPDGVRLEAWQCAASPGYPTIVYFHGNAANLADRAAKFSTFTDSGFGLIAISYRGFGKSEGSPDEAGIYNDARGTIDYAASHYGLTPDRLIYFGESLGSGVAVQMATEKPPALLMLEAAYTSVKMRSAELYPFILGVKYLVMDKYDSLSKIKNVHAPLLMLHGAKDTIIPLRHGKQLFEAANEPKEMVIYPEVYHADYNSDQILVPLMRMSKKLGLIL